MCGYARFLDAKNSNNEKATSGLYKEGARGSFFYPNQILQVSEDLPEIKVTKVGDKGKAVRRYLACCGTPLGTVEKPFWALNANCLYVDREATQQYNPDNTVHTMKKFSFDPTRVPDEAYTIAPITDILRLLGVMINPFGPSTDAELLDKFQVDADTAEVVPITWE